VQQGQEVTIQSEATDDRGVIRVELWVDGILVRSDASPQANGHTPFIAGQPWRADTQGSHAVVSKAYDAEGQVADSPVLILTVAAPGSTPAGPTAEPTLEATAEAATDSPTLPPTLRPPPSTDTPTATPTHTATPTRTPTATPACSADVDPTLANAWSQALLGCPTGPSAIVWSAWEPFQRGNMFWRQDTDWAYVLNWQNGTDPNAGDWLTGGNPWKWDGSFPDGHGLAPPAGLYEPIRGFGYVWYNFLGGPGSSLGWATDVEKGVCARIQGFETGNIVRSTKVGSCDGNFNRGQEPSFSHFLVAMYDDQSWKAFTP